MEFDVLEDARHVLHEGQVTVTRTWGRLPQRRRLVLSHPHFKRRSRARGESVS